MITGTGMSALRVEGFTFTYSGAELPALDSVDLEIEAGELVVLAGPSASGKSTLLRLACGLVPHFHGGTVAGSARVAGVDVLAAGPGELAAWAGLVAQEPETQVVSTTVEAEIGLGLDLRGIGGSDRARAVEETALALAIPHLLERTVDELSGGELQRVALAAALATGPEVILLDEPTSQLDPVAGDELIWLLRRLNAEWGVTVVLAEHRLERCLPAADRVVAMEAGRIGFDGRPEGFLAWAERSAPGLATPISRMLSLAGLRGRPAGVRDARRLLASAGVLPARLQGGVRAVASPEGEVRAKPASEGGSFGSPRRAGRSEVALEAERLWVEVDAEPEPVEVLREVNATVGRGERVALMGRNGAGKSTLLRAAAGLLEPAAGRVEAPGGIALLTQAPGDYLVRERVGDELPGPGGAELLTRLGLEGLADADPRDLSGGERQRLALAIALAGRLGQEGCEGDEGPDGHDGQAGQVGLVALDEPTRGLDRDLKESLAELCRELAARGLAVLLATHDVEFAAGFADRVLLMGKGHLVADGPAAEVLSGGWYFSTEVARVLGLPGVTTPEQGARAIGELTGAQAEASR